ncbi:hypothetical protein GCM10020331_011400 [Ectobacillus funiculus]
MSSQANKKEKSVVHGHNSDHGQQKNRLRPAPNSPTFFSVVVFRHISDGINGNGNGQNGND